MQADRDKFEANLQRQPSGCWEWQKSRHPGGHGYTWHNGRALYAHRRAYELFRGPIPADTKVLHRCDNPPCCNPEHLFLGSQADNVADAVSKRRHAHGERTSSARLTQNDVVDIRSLHAFGASRIDIAAAFGLSLSHTNAVIGRRFWDHVL